MEGKTCEIPKENATDAEIKGLLLKHKTIAVVGMSRNPEKDAHKVPKYMMEHGYDIIPVNPFADRILGLKCHSSLAGIRKRIDIVDIFRPPEEAEQIVKEAIKIRPKAVWMQKGIVSNRAAATARKAGIVVVMDRCIMVEHMRLFH